MLDGAKLKNETKSNGVNCGGATTQLLTWKEFMAPALDFLDLCPAYSVNDKGEKGPNAISPSLVTAPFSHKDELPR